MQNREIMGHEFCYVFVFVSGYMKISMFLLNSSVFGRNMEISTFLVISFSCREVHGNFHVPFAKISSINSFFDSVFSFWQL